MGHESPDSGYEDLQVNGPSSLKEPCDEPRTIVNPVLAAGGLCSRPEASETMNLLVKPESAHDHQQSTSVGLSFQQSDKTGYLGLEPPNTQGASFRAGCGVSNDQMQGDVAFVAGDFVTETARLWVSNVLAECPGNGWEICQSVVEKVQMCPWRPGLIKEMAHTVLTCVKIWMLQS